MLNRVLTASVLMTIISLCGVNTVQAQGTSVTDPTDGSLTTTLSPRAINLGVKINWVADLGWSPEEVRFYTVGKDNLGNETETLVSTTDFAAGTAVYDTMTNAYLYTSYSVYVGSSSGTCRIKAYEYQSVSQPGVGTVKKEQQAGSSSSFKLTRQ